MCAYQVFHWLCVPYLFAGYYSVNTTVMSSVPSNVAAHATATSAPDHPVWFHGSRGENFSSLLGVWHRGKRSVQDIVDQIQVKISSPGGIAEVVQVPTLRTSSALTPSTGQGPQKRAKPQVATNAKFPKSPNVPIGAPHPRNPAGVPGMVGAEIDGHPQGAIRGPQSLSWAREPLLAPRIGQ